MTPLLLLFWGSFILGLSGAVMPGPVLTATIGEVTRRGFVAGPLIIVGHGILEILLLAGLLLGLGAWLTQGAVMGTLGAVGGAILIGLGLHAILTAEAAVRASENSAAAPVPVLRGPVLAGILTTLSNPYWYLWWATVGLSFAAESLAYGKAGLSSFFTGHISADLAWYSLVAIGVARGRRLLSVRAYKGVLIACGVILIGIGVIFLVLGIGHFQSPAE